MDVCWISTDGVQGSQPGALPDLLRRDDGFVWVDVESSDDDAMHLLREVLALDDEEVADCRTLHIIPKLREGAEHVFVALHGAHRGRPGQVHLLELDQFIGGNYLVCVYGPVGVGVDPARCRDAVEGVKHRLAEGSWRPSTPAELSHALGVEVAEGVERLVADLASQIAQLERRVMEGQPRDPEATLEQLFAVRHELLTCRTIAGHSRQVYVALRRLAPRLGAGAQGLLDDLEHRFGHVRSLTEVEGEFLAGVVDLFETRTATRMNVAMERLTLIAALALPLTVIASIYGMNIIGPGQTQVGHLVVVLAGMATLSAVLLAWTRRHGWW